MRHWLLAVLVASALSVHCILSEGVKVKVKGRRRLKDSRTQLTEHLNGTLSNSEQHGDGKVLELHGVDPHGSWMHFVKRPSDNFPGKCRKKKRPLPGPPGPAGPPGLQGPPGAPGAEVTQDVLLQEFRQMIKEATERRVTALERQTSSEAPPPDLVDLGDMTSLRRIEEAFHCKLRGPITVEKKTLMELQSFQMPSAKGAFLRGTGMDVSSGRFTAPVAGIYQLSANVHIDHSGVRRSRGQLISRENVRVLICIQSLCSRHTSLEIIASLEAKSKLFTVYVHGLLELQAGQYVSLFVNNGAAAPISIQGGSDFTGLLLGL